MEKLTPMMQQYLNIKEKYTDCILFFRLGDFYEMFFEDALEASKILEIALTGKSCGLEERAPMCGIPYHSYEGYLKKLIEAGKKVAICEQVEDPKEVKGIVKREVVRIVTPGTYIQEDTPNASENNYILSVCYEDKKGFFSFCHLDVSTGELNLSLVNEFDFADIFYKISPIELIADGRFLTFLKSKEKQAVRIRMFVESKNICVNPANSVEGSMEEHFFDRSYLEANNLYQEEYEQVLFSFRNLLSYIEYTQKVAALNISKIKWVHYDNYLKLDYNSIKNLELLQSSLDKERRHSLYGILNRTKTAMGSRLLRSWIERPLKSRKDIDRRLDLVEEGLREYSLREDLIGLLDSVYDIERICAKLSYDTVTVRDMINLKESLYHLPALKETIRRSRQESLIDAFGDIDPLGDVYAILEEAIADHPTGTIKDGVIIREGYNEQLDELRMLETDAARILSNLELRERNRTGIKTLKIGYNKVFGYYIEVTKAAHKNVELPLEYIRKQTLANAERYINEELKELETKILSSKQKATQLQSELYASVKREVSSCIHRMQKTASYLAELDAVLSLSSVAADNNYNRPSFNERRTMHIREGRHPVIEKLTEDGIFVPNDIDLKDERSFMIITGPNMGGKSTYMRQVALICLMAHMGSFVPAAFANIPILDAIFTRVGASDDLSRGQSTFMVEMNEVSYILEHASKNSLVILDEVGRGTSTYDGMSLAWSIIAHLCEKVGAFSLFSTHYHEITEIEKLYSSVVNYCVAVDEREDTVVFLRKVVRGKADKSYGIHVARLAKLPEEVIQNARFKLDELQASHSQKKGLGSQPLPSYFESPRESGARDKIIDKLAEVDIETTTPLEAMVLLMELKKMTE